jgi:hypothetical protein
MAVKGLIFRAKGRLNAPLGLRNSWIFTVIAVIIERARGRLSDGRSGETGFGLRMGPQIRTRPLPHSSHRPRKGFQTLLASR